ncbi:hypothetical protein AVEN_188258-1 [Araneus ventricosus]|uniref:Uncharacterized protein n=1 Tax=Araneus ventricosus TaxID=182803 RepID=A0A4Y2HD54_ARAVE|nr:hypothetical protein AVEN_188258-1 [Araneus ventricosus]
MSRHPFRTMEISLAEVRARSAESYARTFALATSPLSSKRCRVIRSPDEICRQLSSKDHESKILEQNHRKLIDQIDLLQTKGQGNSLGCTQLTMERMEY